MVGILTFYWADDCGAMLQAYALKTYLESKGEIVEMIPYAPLKLYGRYQFIPLRGGYQRGEWRYYRDFRTFCWNICFFRQFMKRRRSMSHFRKRYLTEKRPIKVAEDVCLQPYDFVLVGSDQVWNSEITFGLNDVYLGNIKQGNQGRLIAYGASFGKNVPPKQEWEKLKRMLNENFAAISLRERGAADFVRRLLHRSAAEVLDPVLLLEKNAWAAIERKPREREYILFYATEPQECMLRFTNKLSEAYHMPVIWLSCPYKWQHRNGVLVRMGAGPEDFVGYFHYASFIITNSFHGLAFSVLFEKQFLVFRHRSLHARLENLLEKLSLKSRLMETGKEELASMEEAIPWSTVWECLQCERERSKKFLRESMEQI